MHTPACSQQLLLSILVQPHQPYFLHASSFCMERGGLWRRTTYSAINFPGPGFLFSHNLDLLGPAPHPHSSPFSPLVLASCLFTKLTSNVGFRFLHDHYRKKALCYRRSGCFSNTTATLNSKYIYFWPQFRINLRKATIGQNHASWGRFTRIKLFARLQLTAKSLYSYVSDSPAHISRVLSIIYSWSKDPIQRFTTSEGHCLVKKKKYRAWGRYPRRSRSKMRVIFSYQYLKK